MRLRHGTFIGKRTLRRRSGLVFRHRNGNRSQRVPNDSAGERWRTRVDAAWDHRQRRGHWIYGYDGAARQRCRTVQRD